MPNPSPTQAAHRSPVLLLSLVWLAAVVVVNPVGDFPLNDDWGYGWTVKRLLDSGTFLISDWSATHVAPQALWGWLFTAPFGFSFTALRLSTLVLGLAGVLATYGLLRELHATPRMATLGALLVAFNPLYFAMSLSFNTDVPSFALSIASLYCLTRGLNRCSPGLLAAGIALSLAGTLNRQSGIAVLLGFAAAVLLKHRWRWRTLLLAGLPLLAALALNALFTLWLDSRGATPALQGMQIRMLTENFSGDPGHLLGNLTGNTLRMAIYSGLFLFPFLLAVMPRLSAGLPRSRRLFPLWTTGVGGAAGLAFFLKGYSMPLMGNVLLPFGLGPLTLSGYNAGMGSFARLMMTTGWSLATIVGVMGAGLLVLFTVLGLEQVVQHLRNGQAERTWPLVMNGVIIVLYVGAIAGLDQSHWYDRYLVFLLPPLLAVVHQVMAPHGAARTAAEPTTGAYAGGRAFSAALTLVFLFGLFSIPAAHDYLAWNRVRWQALNGLMQDKAVPPQQIDGGFEFNGWHQGNELERCNPSYRSTDGSLPDWEDFTCLSLGVDGPHAYNISFLHLPNHDVESKRTFRRWLGWKRQSVFLLRRNGG